MTLLQCFLAASLLAAPGTPRASVEFTKDSLEVVKKSIARKKAVLLDVRSEEEWKQGYVDGAIFVPITSLRKHSLDPKQLAKKLPRKKVLYTYCAVGMRAKAAARILQDQGYTVRALKPGYEELIKAGFKKGPPQEPKDEPAAPAVVEGGKSRDPK